MLNILVVDDFQTGCRVVAKLLRRAGHMADSAYGGEAALAMLNERHYDVVLLDVMMPDVNGFEVLRQIKRHPRTRDVHVLVYSAADCPADRQAALEGGADAYLVKGRATFADILERLETAIGGSVMPGLGLTDHPPGLPQAL